MFNFGFSELIFLGAIALLVIGPKQLPEVAKVLAKTINELKRATADLGKTLNDTKDTIAQPIKDMNDQVMNSLDPDQKEEEFASTPETEEKGKEDDV